MKQSRARRRPYALHHITLPVVGASRREGPLFGGSFRAALSRGNLRGRDHGDKDTKWHKVRKFAVAQNGQNRSRNRSTFNLHAHRPRVWQTQGFRRSVREIDNPAFDVWSAIVDANDNRLSGSQRSDAHMAAER